MNSNDKKIDGKKQAAELLAHLDSDHRERILNDIRKTDPVMADALQKNMYHFEQVFKLEAPELQKLIQSVPSRLFALSLRGLDEDLKKALSAKLSNRQMQMLDDEVQSLGPQRASDIKQAQDKIAAQAGQMHEQGSIRLILK